MCGISNSAKSTSMLVVVKMFWNQRDLQVGTSAMMLMIPMIVRVMGMMRMESRHQCSLVDYLLHVWYL
jgi:hypothetical protein